MLIAARHLGTSKLWKVNGTLLTESSLFDCAGIGKASAETLLQELYPLYPTLDSVAILAAYVIYRVKNNTDGCGLKTEIRFIHRNMLGVVPPDLIDSWEAIFRRYDKINREVFHHGMNFVIAPELPPMLADRGFLPPQMRPLPEIVKSIEQLRAELNSLTIFKP